MRDPKLTVVMSIPDCNSFMIFETPFSKYDHLFATLLLANEPVPTVTYWLQVHTSAQDPLGWGFGAACWISAPLLCFGEYSYGRWEIEEDEEAHTSLKKYSVASMIEKRSKERLTWRWLIYWSSWGSRWISHRSTSLMAYILSNKAMILAEYTLWESSR